MVAAVSAALYPFQPFFASLLGVLAIVFFFKGIPAFLLLFLYAFFVQVWGSSAFILDMDYGKNGITYYTTKGIVKNLEKNATIGDFISGGFTHETVRSSFSGLPYQRHQLTGKYELYRVAFVSSFLEARERESARLLLASGGEIVSTQAHIYAVRKYISPKMTDEYIITGLAHLLAMSGFHVGIFTGGFFLLLFFLPRKLRAIPVILLLPLLIPISGFTVTVVRSVIFALTALLAWVFDLKLSALHLLAVLAGLFLIFTPQALFSISFLLSFFAVFGILSLMKRRYGPVRSIVIVGIASTVFTLPLQLWFFGTSNVFSIVTTAIMTPVVWVQMVLGLLAVPFGEFIIAPLALVERFAAWLMEKLALGSWYFMYVAKPPTVLLVASFLTAFSLSFTRVRLLALLILLLPLLPVYEGNILIFPKLAPSQKGYILKTGESTEIFYQGMYKGFVRNMLPEAARMGIKNFDYGQIRIFDGENRYIRIKSPGEFSGLVCINEMSGCPYQYMTRSGSLTSPLDENVKLFVIYNNKLADERIIIQKELEGNFQIKLE